MPSNQYEGKIQSYLEKNGGQFSILDLYRTPDAASVIGEPPRRVNRGSRAQLKQNRKEWEDYRNATKNFLTQYKDNVMRGLTDQATGAGKKQDQMLSKIENIAGGLTDYADEAYNEITAAKDKYNDYFEDLKNNYKDIIPETIAEARTGVVSTIDDTRGSQDRAESDVRQAYETGDQTMAMEMGRYGVNPTSNRFSSALRERTMAEAGDVAGARTTARLNERDRTNRNRVINYEARSALTRQGETLIAGAGDRINEMALAAANAKLKGGEAAALQLDTYGKLSDEYGEAAGGYGEAAAIYAEGNKEGYSENVGATTQHYKPLGIYAGQT